MWGVNSPASARFAFIVRTQGLRPGPLADALQSIALQKLPSRAVVAVHGDELRLAGAREICRASDADCLVLHAPDTSRKVGYPANAALDYCLAEPQIEYIGMLDDDDVVYPFFANRLVKALQLMSADVAYAASNRRDSQNGLAPAFAARPIYCLLQENFIPTNAFAVRAEALRRSGVRFDETREYFEDWDFLLRLLAAGLRFAGVAETLSEFRIVPDAYLGARRDLDRWNIAAAEMRAYINRTSFAMPGAALAQMSVARAKIGRAHV